MSSHVNRLRGGSFVLGREEIGREEFGRVEDAGVDGRQSKGRACSSLRALRAARSREENSTSVRRVPGEPRKW